MLNIHDLFLQHEQPDDQYNRNSKLEYREDTNVMFTFLAWDFVLQEILHIKFRQNQKERNTGQKEYK